MTATATTPIAAGTIRTQWLIHRSDGVAATAAHTNTTIHARGDSEAPTASPTAPLASSRPTPTPEASAAATTTIAAATIVQAIATRWTSRCAR